MDETAVIDAIAKTGVGGAIVFVLFRVLSKIFERMIAAIDRIAARVDEHTAKDLEHHGEVRDAVTRMEAKLDSARLSKVRSDRADRARRSDGQPRSTRGRVAP